MRDVVHHVEAGNLLLPEEIDGMRILLAEDRHQHVGAGDFFPARRLHVVDGSLQHALEAQRRLRVARVVAGQQRHGLGDDAAQVIGQLVDIGAAGAQDARRRFVLQQRQQQMLDRHELMTCLARLLVALANGEFEVLAEHGRCSGDPSCQPVIRLVLLRPLQAAARSLLQCRGPTPAPSCTAAGAGVRGKSH